MAIAMVSRNPKPDPQTSNSGKENSFNSKKP